MNIQKRIKEHGFTISEVAAKLKNSRGGIGISQGSLSTILSGNPTIGKLKEIADIIGCTLPEIVADDEEVTAQIKCPKCGEILTITIK